MRAGHAEPAAGPPQAFVVQRLRSDGRHYARQPAGPCAEPERGSRNRGGGGDSGGASVRGRKDGRTEGRKDGRTEGRKDGRTEGRKDGNQNVANRSEEHTSELQSRENLVCRLLLEKKKKRH